MNWDYDTLRLIFWACMVVCVLGFALCEGLSLGIGMVQSLAGITIENRRIINRSIAPAALSGLAWLPVTLALLFAAWPIVFAVIFSGLQWLLIIILPAWMCRPLGLLYGNAGETPRWLQNWDKALGFSSVLLTAFLGILAGNLLKGIPFHLDSDMRIFFLGDIRDLLNPFALLTASVSLSLFIMYAAGFLQLISGNTISGCYSDWVIRGGALFLILFTLTGLWLMHLEGYHINSEIISNAAANPLNKFVKRADGLWLDNYEHIPALWILPGMAFSAAAAAMYLTKGRKFYFAMLACTTTVTATVLTLAASMFPFLLPSNRSLNTSLTIWDAGAGMNSLSVLLPVVLFALPLMLFACRYTWRISRLEARA
ncbi:MAG: cytochrome d ubiquinol oxidase subunit II [Methylomonas sp.]|jgi:cytochrome d ubiquinol oxidase subunit II